MTTSRTNTEKRIIVAFKIGRGGRFHNAGHVTYIGEKNLNDLIQYNDSDLFEHNRDSKGRFCKPFLSDSNGTVILDSEDYGKETGTLDFDGEYNTVTCCYIEDCNENDLEMIKNDDNYKSPELEDFLNNN